MSAVTSAHTAMHLLRRHNFSDDGCCGVAALSLEESVYRLGYKTDADATPLLTTCEKRKKKP